MPTFTYEALNPQGQTHKGTIEAASSEEAVQRIKAQGYFPTAVREQKVKKPAATGPGGAAKRRGTGFTIGTVSRKQLTTFTRQLSTLQDAGLPLLRSLQILEQQQKPGKLKSVLAAVCEDVEGGSALSEAMARHPRVFDRLYTKMIAAGEVGGVLDVILQRLAEFLEKSIRLRRKIRGAMVYPAVVITVAVAILTFIMIWIVPQFEQIFMEFGVELPWLTQRLIEASRWVAGSQAGQQVPGWVFILTLPVLLWLFFKLIRRAGPGRAVTDMLVMWMPIFGGLVRKSVIARFTRTLGTLVAAGVPILEAILITRDTCGNWVFERALTRVHDSIREGETFADPLRESKACDAIVVNMIAVGEETGELDAMLLKVADNYDEEVDVAVGALVSLLEPVLILTIGLIVGTIVVSMFLPLVAMINSLAQGGQI